MIADAASFDQERADRLDRIRGALPCDRDPDETAELDFDWMTAAEVLR